MFKIPPPPPSPSTNPQLIGPGMDESGAHFAQIWPTRMVCVPGGGDQSANVLKIINFSRITLEIRVLSLSHLPGMGQAEFQLTRGHAEIQLGTVGEQPLRVGQVKQSLKGREIKRSNFREKSYC